MKISKNKCNGLFGKVKFGEGKSCTAYCKPIAKYHLEENKWKLECIQPISYGL